MELGLRALQAYSCPLPYPKLRWLLPDWPSAGTTEELTCWRELFLTLVSALLGLAIRLQNKTETVPVECPNRG